jgi:hypothetical protein
MYVNFGLLAVYSTRSISRVLIPRVKCLCATNVSRSVGLTPVLTSSEKAIHAFTLQRGVLEKFRTAAKEQHTADRALQVPMWALD